MDTRSDEELVCAIQEGDIFAFEVLVRRYQQKLYYFVGKYIRDEQASQDVVQESFISFYRAIDRVDRSRKISSYLYSVVRNAAISYLRTTKKRISLDAIAELESGFTMEEEYIRNEDSEEIRQVMKTLDPKYSSVLRLYYFDELSYEEMSNVLHIPINTVRTHLKRAKEALEKKLHHEKD